MKNNIHQFLKDQSDEISASVEGLTLIDLLNRNADEFGDFPALNEPANSEYTSWNPMSWAETRDLVHRVAAGLISIGLNPLVSIPSSLIISSGFGISSISTFFNYCTPTCMAKSCK